MNRNPDFYRLLFLFICASLLKLGCISYTDCFRNAGEIIKINVAEEKTLYSGFTEKNVFSSLNITIYQLQIN